MVLSKRKADGEFVTWAPGGSSAAGSSPVRASSHAHGLPEPTAIRQRRAPANKINDELTLSSISAPSRRTTHPTPSVPPLPAKAPAPSAQRQRRAKINDELTLPSISAPSTQTMRTPSGPSMSALPAHTPHPPVKRQRRVPVNKINDELTLPSIPATLTQNARVAPSGSSQPRVAPTTSQPQPASSQPSSSGPSSSQAPPKRTRKKKDPNAPVPEKRGAIFKPRCPQNIWDRVERVREQRFFMIDRRRNSGELREEFSVLGSTGNVYTVTIDKTPRCDCPDALKGNHCKHILFIFLKVLQVTQASGFWYQKALLTTELETIFAEAPLAPNDVTNPRIREAHDRALGKATAVTPAAQTKKRIPGADDDCPICYDGMHGVAETALVFCEECGNALHKECFGQWRTTSVNNGKELNCVWCRARWVVGGAAAPGAAAAGGARRQGGYLNLGGVAGISPVRDTSTYYHGPRRGQRYYGDQEYDDF